MPLYEAAKIVLAYLNYKFCVFDEEEVVISAALKRRKRSGERENRTIFKPRNYWQRSPP